MSNRNIRLVLLGALTYAVSIIFGALYTVYGPYYFGRFVGWVVTGNTEFTSDINHHTKAWSIGLMSMLISWVVLFIIYQIFQYCSRSNIVSIGLSKCERRGNSIIRWILSFTGRSS